MTDLNVTALIIRLNINGLNAPIKRQRFSGNQMHFKYKITNELKVKGLIKIQHDNSNQKKARVAM